jgi:hypothetical protein
MWKWNCRWARKEGFRSLFCWTGAGPGRLEAEYKEENSVLGGWTAHDTVAGSCWHSRDRLESWSRALELLLRSSYCPLIRRNPGWLLAFLPATTPWEDTFTLWDWTTVSCVGNAEQSRRPQLMSCVSEVLETHRHTYLGSFFLALEGIRWLSLGAIWDFIKSTGLSWLGL